MTYSETLDYLFSSLPMYHRIGQAAYKADIANTVQLMSHLGNPERKFRSIHVAGTNGKGSVSHTLASVLMQAGYKVGLYTSPHLVDFRERIRINGQMIPEQEVAGFVGQHRDFMQTLQLSFFEMTVGLAFDYFAHQQVDVAVVEVGMGGRLDSTNVIRPDLCIITNIGFDHTQFLGSTLPEIAGEKAGIIKPGIPVVIGETHPETRPVFEQKAAETNAPICFADDKYAIEDLKTGRLKDDKEGGPSSLPLDTELHFAVHPIGGTYRSPLSGSYQLKNLATLFQALELLPQLGYRITDGNVRQGIARVVADTGLRGRWDKVGEHPLTICETAHNADGIRAMLQKLSELPYRRLHLVYGCVNDKDYGSILRMLPRRNTAYYYSQPSVPRGLPCVRLAAAAAEAGMPGECFRNVRDAVARARSLADPQRDLVLVTGSIFLVADMYDCE